MAGQGDGEGKGPKTLDSQIFTIKYSIFFFNVIVWMMAAAVFAMTIWLRFEPGIDEWVTKLKLQAFNAGLYVLIASSILVMVVAFIGCGAALMESRPALLVFIVLQVLGFICGLSGSAVLLDYSTYDSHIQPLIRDSMGRLIANSGNHEPSRITLQMIQENIGCCGADGPNDYLTWRQPLPPTCRDTVTGNAFFYGCVDELTWFFEEKAGWVSGIAMAICFIHVINVVLSVVLMQAIEKEDEIQGFKH